MADPPGKELTIALADQAFRPPARSNRRPSRLPPERQECLVQGCFGAAALLSRSPRTTSQPVVPPLWPARTRPKRPPSARGDSAATSGAADGRHAANSPSREASWARRSGARLEADLASSPATTSSTSREVSRPARSISSPFARPGARAGASERSTGRRPPSIPHPDGSHSEFINLAWEYRTSTSQ